MKPEQTPPQDAPSIADSQEPSGTGELSSFDRCQDRIGYQFEDLTLLRAALTHASSADDRLASNERLEFLGDAIFGAIVCEELYHRYPGSLEGDLTRIKSVVVSRNTCARMSDSLGLDEFLILGRGITVTGQVPRSLLSDVFESLVAAIYLDGGHQAACDFIHRNVKSEIDSVALDGDENYKSALQQLVQRKFNSTPTYELVDEKGPDHSKCFKVAAHVDGQCYQAAWGGNKKEAEQRAACNALSEMKNESAPFPTDE